MVVNEGDTENLFIYIFGILCWLFTKKITVKPNKYNYFNKKKTF